MRINILSGFMYGDWATEECFKRALENLGHEVFMNNEGKFDINLVVHLNYTFGLSNSKADHNLLYMPDSIEGYDLNLLNNFDSIFLFQKHKLIDNKRIFYLPHGYDSRINEWIKDKKFKKLFPISFVGTWYPEREWMNQLQIFICGNGWKNLKINSLLTTEEKWQLAKYSHICLNHVRPPDTDNNARMYELAALGCVQISNIWNEDFTKFMSIDKLTYSNNNIFDIMKALSTDDNLNLYGNWMREIIKPYTYEYRMKQMFKMAGIE